MVVCILISFLSCCGVVLLVAVSRLDSQLFIDGRHYIWVSRTRGWKRRWKRKWKRRWKRKWKEVEKGVEKGDEKKRKGESEKGEAESERVTSV